MAATEHTGEPDSTVCAFVGHEWGDAGGGLQICVVCEAERWSDEGPAPEQKSEAQA